MQVRVKLFLQDPLYLIRSDTHLTDVTGPENECSSLQMLFKEMVAYQHYNIHNLSNVTQYYALVIGPALKGLALSPVSHAASSSLPTLDMRNCMNGLHWDWETDEGIFFLFALTCPWPRIIWFNTNGVRTVDVIDDGAILAYPEDTILVSYLDCMNWVYGRIHGILGGKGTVKTACFD